MQGDMGVCWVDGGQVLPIDKVVPGLLCHTPRPFATAQPAVKALVHNYCQNGDHHHHYCNVHISLLASVIPTTGLHIIDFMVAVMMITIATSPNNNITT